MDKIKIKGKKRLFGEVQISGAKNAALPILASALLCDGKSVFHNVPDLVDVRSILMLSEELGAKTQMNNGVVEIDSSGLNNHLAPYEIVRKMRASILVLGPLVARLGKACVSLPGGCAIGARPVNLHIEGLEKLGAEVHISHGYINASAKRLKGNEINFDTVTVTGTENLMMAAVFAKGETVLENTAREPEILNLVETLRSMGAIIEADGTGVIRIQGVDSLHSAESRIIPDRIEACTYILAGAATNGEVTVTGVIPNHIDSLLAKLEEAGAQMTVTHDEVTIHPSGRLKGVSLKTLPYPGFPTDLQPQIMASLCIAQGTSVIQESVFQSRFLHVSELNKMGAKIDIQGNTAIVSGVDRLTGADVVATDLRAGAALVISGLAAGDSTYIYHLGHIRRGYEDMEEKLKSLGADVEILPAEIDGTRESQSSVCRES
ncbi:MAG: UDP-N-acetylglucosamine 1-carboxyvinyltransferase [Verrucomicrobiae bacterium]|nr:UDP-N-acetylglucosamine 1-carboxyvinyltransferase [Verrucomicrobiae bacterium]